MNPTPRHFDPVTDEQAALWAARLDGSVLSATDRLALDEWLAGDPARRTLLSHYCQFSADLEQQLPLIAGIREMSAEIPAPKTAQPLPWLRRPLMAGAMLTAAAAVALVFWSARPHVQRENIATPVASRQSLTLADGTRVELNALTSLQIEIDGQGRRVRLATGEAFFAVRKDPTRPFTVETPAGSVRVTGTQFDVRSDSATTLEVTVLEGSVQARPGKPGRADQAPVSLVACERLIARDGEPTVVTLSAKAIDDDLAWRQGQIVFKDVPLGEALAAFSRYHGRSITPTPEAAALRVGARYSLDDLDGFLAALEESHGVKVTPNLNGTVLVSRRGDR